MSGGSGIEVGEAGTDGGVSFGVTAEGGTILDAGVNAVGGSNIMKLWVRP